MTREREALMRLVLVLRRFFRRIPAPLDVRAELERAEEVLAEGGTHGG